MRIWGRARTAAEIATGLHHLVSETDPDLLLRCSFDDGDAHVPLTITYKALSGRDEPVFSQQAARRVHGSGRQPTECGSRR